MKNLNELLNEALNVNEAKNHTMDDIEKVGKMMNDSKLNAFIKKHESDITGDRLGSSDIKDIIEIIKAFHDGVSYMIEDEPESLEMYIEDAPENLADDYEEDWIDAAIDLYKKLYKEVTHKDLV